MVGWGTGDKNVVPASGYSWLLENLMRSIPAIRKTTYRVNVHSQKELAHWTVDAVAQINGAIFS